MKPCAALTTHQGGQVDHRRRGVEHPALQLHLNLNPGRSIPIRQPSLTKVARSTIAGEALSIQRSSSASRQAAKSCITTSAWLSNCSQSPAQGRAVSKLELIRDMRGKVVHRHLCMVVQLLPVACSQQHHGGGLIAAHTAATVVHRHLRVCLPNWQSAHGNRL